MSGAFDFDLTTLPEPALAWLQALRTEASTQFSNIGLPSSRDEDWRYTQVSALAKKTFAPVLTAHHALDSEWLKKYQLAEAWCLVLVDGQFRAELSQLQGLPAAVQVLSMADAVQNQATFVEAYLGKAVDSTEHGFIALNTAGFSDGVFVQIPAGLVLEQPIQCLHIATQADALALTRHIVVVHDGASVQWIETFVGAEVSYLSVAVTEAFVGQNAQLSTYKLQVESTKAYHFAGLYCQQARDARFSQQHFAFGGLLARSETHSDLAHAAECELNGLYLGGNRQHLDHHTRINHLQAYGCSRELYKGVLNDRARGVFQGRVLVAKQAQKTDSTMNNRNLLLSAEAEADTKPQLEIYADDVKCSHGVTVGQLDEKSVFYLQSRGVDESTSRNMLTFAFANEMVEKIKLKALHDQVLTEVLTRFPQAGMSQDWL